MCRACCSVTSRVRDEWRILVKSVNKVGKLKVCAETLRVIASAELGKVIGGRDAVAKSDVSCAASCADHGCA